MKQTPVQVITRTGILLALMVAVQVFKNLSPWITGPLVNAILILGTLGAGIYSGVALSVIAPVTALLIVQQPLMPLTGYTL
ncbi:MAG: ECF transporter S component, partial [Clostridia bacterium]|nr:ECF transporter S component [Clostridia bacterium]